MKLQDIQNALSAISGQLLPVFESLLNLEECFNDFQSGINETLNALVPKFEKASGTFPQYIMDAQPFIAPGAYIVGVIMVIIAIAFIICLMVHISEAWNAPWLSSGKLQKICIMKVLN